MKKGKLTLTAVLALALAGLGFAQKVFITIGSGSTTGVYYPVAVGVAKLINDNLDNVRANARSTGGSVYNALAIAKGELQMTMIQNDVAFYAYTGTVRKEFEGKPVEKLRGLATLYPEPVQIIARADSGIKSIADMKGKKVYVGDVGSGVEVNSRQIFEAYGMTFDDLGQAVRGRANQAAQLLQDGRIDALIYTAGLGTATIAQPALTTDVVFVPIDLDKIQYLRNKYPFYAQFVIPAGFYSGKPTVSVPTVTVKATLAASADLPEEVVYNIMKLLFDEKFDEFKKIHANLEKYFTLDKALDGMPIPLHPGAVKFYQEKGIEVPAELLPPGM